MKNIQNPKYILAACSVLFFIIYSYLAFVSPDKFVSPDEVANYHFTQLYAQTGELRYSEDLNIIAEGIIHPRGAVFTDGYVTSAKFLGFQVVNGTLSVIIPDIIRFLTPLLSVIGALVFYLMIRDIFNPKIALLSYFLLLILPTYWYWSSLSMFENIAGCTMIIISFRYFFILPDSDKVSHYVLFGLFFGLSLFIRPDYILLVIPLGIIMLWKIKTIKKLYLIYAFLAFIISFGPFLILNNILYGSPILTGQHVQYDTSQIFLNAESNFGNIFSNSANLINLMPVIFLCTLLGVVFWVKSNGLKSKYFVFAILSLLVFSFYYLDDKVIETSLHSSYVRYLLPASILFIPFISYFILNFQSKIVPIFLIFILVIINALTIIPPIKSNLDSVEGYALLSQNIASVTESDAVIFLDYWDKAIFPERRVAIISELPEENRPEKFSDISTEIYNRGIPVYVYFEVELTQIVKKETMAQILSQEGFLLQETGVRDLYKLIEKEK